MSKKGAGKRPGASIGTRPPVRPASPKDKPTTTPPSASTLTAKVGADPSKDLVPKKKEYPATVTKIKGKWGEYARTVVDVLKDNNMKLKGNPLAQFAIVFCAFMGKYSKYLDMIPGNFRKKLDKGDLLKEKFDADQKARLRAQMAAKVPENLQTFDPIYKAINAKRVSEKKPILDRSEASTLYVSHLLFGAPLASATKDPHADYITDPNILAAKLAHEYTDLNKRAYADSGFSALKKMKSIPKGTVIFFYPPKMKSGKLAAYYDGHQFVYYVPGSKDRKSFKLGASNSPIRNGLQIVAAFVPTSLQPSVSQAPAAPTKTATFNPDILASSATKTIVDVEKTLKAAALKQNKVLRYTELANILSTSIAKIEDLAKKVKLLKPQQYAKIKEKYEKAMKKYHLLITATIKLFAKDMAGIMDKMTKLPPQIKKALAANKKKVAAGLKLELIKAQIEKKALDLIKPYIDKIREYLKRAKELLPKSTS